MVFKRNKKTLKGGSKKLYKGGGTKKNNTNKRKKQKGGGFNIDATINERRKEIKKLQLQVNKNILYDKYDWTKTFKPKTIDSVEYNHMLGLDNDELMTENYYNLLYFVNKSITSFKDGGENVKMYLVADIDEDDEVELRKDEEAYKAKYELENEEPVDLVEGLVRPRKDDTVYFEDLDDQFATMRDFLETRKTNLEACIKKEEDEKNNDTNKEYFEHEIESCSALLDKYDAIDKTDKQALTKFVGEINDTLYLSKKNFDFNKDLDELKKRVEEYVETIKENENDKKVLLTFIPEEYFDENNNLLIDNFFNALKENPYYFQQFIFGINKFIKELYEEIRFIFSMNKTIYDMNNKCDDFVYWNYKYNTYYMYFSVFSNKKVFPVQFLLPYKFKYQNFIDFKEQINTLPVKQEIKDIIKNKDTFAFALSSYGRQIFNPKNINKYKFLGIILIKFNKDDNERIWILFIFENNSKLASHISGIEMKHLICNIQYFITEGANITYRQTITYKELKQYYYESKKIDKNSETTLSFFKIDTTGMNDEDIQKYKQILFITRRNIKDDKFKSLISRTGLKKYNLELLSSKNRDFTKVKFKFGLTGDIFYLDEDIYYNKNLLK